MSSILLPLPAVEQVVVLLVDLQLLPFFRYVVRIVRGQDIHGPTQRHCCPTEIQLNQHFTGTF